MPPETSGWLVITLMTARDTRTGFREAFWLEVAKDTELMGQFSSRNQKTIRAGRAPFTRLNDQAGKRNRFEIHHVEEIGNGGAVYDVENLRVVTPFRHIQVHRRT